MSSEHPASSVHSLTPVERALFDAVLQTAVAALLDKVNRDPNSKLLARTLTEYALSRADEGKSWHNLPDELAGFGQFLFNETVHEAVAQFGPTGLRPVTANLGLVCWWPRPAAMPTRPPSSPRTLRESVAQTCSSSSRRTRT